MKVFPFASQRTWIGRLEKGDDLLQGLTEVCLSEGINAGSLQALGAVECGAIGFFDQEAGQYRETRFDREMELASLIGNISQKDGQTFLHCHVVLADRDGHCYGGHLVEGNRVFACEFVVVDTEGGAVPVRRHDSATGLMLW